MAHYWIKLYSEILDDPKMGTLPDHLYRRVIEIFLMAGDNQNDGYLPKMIDMAWRLRVTEAELQVDLEAIHELTNIIQPVDGRWLVTNFAKRQDAASNAERIARYRNAKHKQEYYSNESLQENVTTRYIDRIDKNTEKNKEGAQAPIPVVPKKAAVPKKPTKERDPLLDHPAVVAYKDVAHLSVPETLRHEVAQTVTEDELHLWRSIIADWIGYGWNPRNIKGMLEAYRAGGIKLKKNGNGNGSQPVPYEYPQEDDWQPGQKFNFTKNAVKT